MFKITVLEDEKTISDMLVSYIREYCRAHELECTIQAFDNSYDFIESHDPHTDIGFFDIDVPGMTGMEAARRIRETNEETIVVFVTNLSQYAIEGYQVNATDYILKPVKKDIFMHKLDRIFGKAFKFHDESYISIDYKSQHHRLRVSEIYFAEVSNHDVFIHYEGGAIKAKGPLSKLAETLMPAGLVFCNVCYLVNLKYVEAIVDNQVVIKGHKLAISKPKKKAFMQALASYLGK